MADGEPADDVPQGDVPQVEVPQGDVPQGEAPQDVVAHDERPATPCATTRPGRRRHRRVVAPPTNPEADQSDDTAEGGPRRLAARPDEPRDPTPRDRWIRDQRPPHWD